MRSPKEILAEIPHDILCPAKTSCGYCNCAPRRTRAAIEQAQQEAIEEAVETAQRGYHEVEDLIAALRALLPHREGQ